MAQKTLLIHNTTRAPHTKAKRTLRAGPLNSTKNLFIGGAIRVIRGQPTSVGENFVMANIAQIAEYEEKGLIEVTDDRRRRVNIPALLQQALATKSAASKTDEALRADAERKAAEEKAAAERAEAEAKAAAERAAAEEAARKAEEEAAAERARLSERSHEISNEEADRRALEEADAAGVPLPKAEEEELPTFDLPEDPPPATQSSSKKGKRRNR